MKKLLLLIILSGVTLSVPAQHYRANQWHIGPTAGFGIYNRNMEKWSEGFSNISPKANIGAFLGYSFTDLLGVQVEGLYDGCFGNISSNTLQIPAMFMLQFAEHNHFGVGLIYQHSYKHPMSIEGATTYYFSAANNNYLSAFVEFSALTEKIFKIGRFTYWTGEIQKTRAYLRFGYAITPASYTIIPQEIVMNDAPKKVEFHPFFFEVGLRLDLLSLSDDGGNHYRKSSGGKIGTKKKSTNKRKR